MSNAEDGKFIEDEYIANVFRKDGHIVNIAYSDYDKSLEDKFDIIIKKNERNNSKKLKN